MLHRNNGGLPEFFQQLQSRIRILNIIVRKLFTVDLIRIGQIAGPG